MEGARYHTPSHWIYLPVLGFYAVLLFLASRVAPDRVSIGMKQQRIAPWQGCSIYVSLSVAFLQWLTSLAFFKPYAFQRSTSGFAFTIACSAIPHLRLVIIGGSWFNLAWKPLAMPRLFWTAEQVQDVKQRANYFLQRTTLPPLSGREVR
jgi:hypothetical protein